MAMSPEEGSTTSGLPPPHMTKARYLQWHVENHGKSSRKEAEADWLSYATSQRPRSGKPRATGPATEMAPFRELGSGAAAGLFTSGTQRRPASVTPPSRVYPVLDVTTPALSKARFMQWYLAEHGKQPRGVAEQAWNDYSHPLSPIPAFGAPETFSASDMDDLLNASKTASPRAPSPSKARRSPNRKSPTRRSPTRGSGSPSSRAARKLRYKKEKYAALVSEIRSALTAKQAEGLIAAAKERSTRFK
jgi:hypothetical protein